MPDPDEIKVVRVSQGIGVSQSRIIPLGVINLSDVAAAGGLKQLIPYTAGRFIRKVFFSPVGYEFFPAQDTVGALVKFVTPNTLKTGIGGWDDFAVFDTEGAGAENVGMGLQLVGGNAILNPFQRTTTLLEPTPLYLALVPFTDQFATVPFDNWVADTTYAIHQILIDPNGNVQYVTTGGTSGGTEPTWAVSAGTTNDGSVVWTFGNPAPTGAIRTYVEVLDLPGEPAIIPTTLEFVQQPTNTASGATITPAVTVKVLDQNGAAYHLYNGGIQLAIYGAGTLAGTAFKDMDYLTGTATFDDLSITGVGTYVLTATSVEVLIAGTKRIYSQSFQIT